MQLWEGLGLLGALATAIMVVFAFRTRRNARQKAQREEDTCLCAAHLNTLGVALHAYRQDHDGELPRKFISPPLALRSQGSGAAWYEASLADYLADTDAYGCPSGGGCYCDRIPLLLRDGPRQLMRPAPESVVMYCPNHGTWDHEYRQGEYVVLRTSGAVERIPASEIELWRYWEGLWYSPDEEAVNEANIFLVFPGEPWPPRLEKVSVPDYP